MSYFPKSILGRVLFVLWFLACFLLLGMVGDPIGFFFGLFVLTTPANMTVFWVRELFDGIWRPFSSFDKLDQAFYAAALIWLECVVAGYIQWFVVVPWIWSKVIKQENRK